MLFAQLPLDLVLEFFNRSHHRVVAHDFRVHVFFVIVSLFSVFAAAGAVAFKPESNAVPGVSVDGLVKRFMFVWC